MNFKLSRHVKEEIQRRNIPLQTLEAVLENPAQIVPERGGKKAYQSQIGFGKGKVLLLRAIVDDSVDPAVVITAYRTSKISKYWRTT